MEELLSWGWEGVLLIVVPFLIIRMVPVALGAWQQNNVILGLIKTVGPLVSLAILLFGGWYVVKEAATFIYSDARSTAIVQDAQRWTLSGGSALESGAGSLGSYVSAFGSGLGGDGAAAGDTFDESKAEWNELAADAGREDLAISADSPAPINAAAEWLQQAGAPRPTPENTPDPALWAPGGIQKLWSTGGQVGPQPAVPTQGPAPRPTATPAGFITSVDGGGPNAAAANAAVNDAAERTYRVQRGDSLATISKKFYGTTDHWRAICTASALRDCNNVAVGKLLVIPPIQP